MQTYRWATLGCGVIAHELAQAMAERGQTLYAVANRTHEKAVAFAAQYRIPKVYDRPEDVFSDPNVDIIYISTPHNTHIGFLRQALRAGKHVLCEKAITLNRAELEEALALIRRVGPREAYITHMSHEIGLHAATETMLPEGVHLAYDTLEIEINEQYENTQG